MLCKSASEISAIGSDALSLSAIPFSSPPPTRGTPAAANNDDDADDDDDDEKDDDEKEDEEDEDGIIGADERDSARRMR